MSNSNLTNSNLTNSNLTRRSRTGGPCGAVCRRRARRRVRRTRRRRARRPPLSLRVHGADGRGGLPARDARRAGPPRARPRQVRQPRQGPSLPFPLCVPYRTNECAAASRCPAAGLSGVLFFVPPRLSRSRGAPLAPGARRPPPPPPPGTNRTRRVLHPVLIGHGGTRLQQGACLSRCSSCTATATPSSPTRRHVRPPLPTLPPMRPLPYQRVRGRESLYAGTCGEGGGGILLYSNRAPARFEYHFHVVVHRSAGAGAVARGGARRGRAARHAARGAPPSLLLPLPVSLPYTHSLPP